MLPCTIVSQKNRWSFLFFLACARMDTSCSVLEDGHVVVDARVCSATLKRKKFSVYGGHPVVLFVAVDSLLCTVRVTIKYLLDARSYARFRSNGTPVHVPIIHPYPFA